MYMNISILTLCYNSGILSIILRTPNGLGHFFSPNFVVLKFLNLLFIMRITAHECILGYLKSSMKEKTIAFFDCKEGLNPKILTKACLEGIEEERTYYLSFNKTRGSSRKKIKGVLEVLLREYNITFIAGQRYYFGPTESESVTTYAFRNYCLVIHFIILNDLMSIKKISDNHQKIKFYQAGDSQEQNLANGE